MVRPASRLLSGHRENQQKLDVSHPIAIAETLKNHIVYLLAAPQGFEPRYADPESAVLPLNEGAARKPASCQHILILWAGQNCVNIGFVFPDSGLEASAPSYIRNSLRGGKIPIAATWGEADANCD
jgi:hypothetical protein